MNVLMLGWEYPPHIAGGLGTACEGLSRGLARQGINVTFLMPNVFGDEAAPHMTLIDSDQILSKLMLAGVADSGRAPTKGSITRFGIRANLMPYWSEQDYMSRIATEGGQIENSVGRSGQTQPRYRANIFAEVDHFTQVASHAGELVDFDVIHVHDWMTFPAGIALKHLSGKPLVAHIHSLECDRSGSNPNPRIRDIEGYGVTQADAVVAVSHYTQQMICRVHSVPEERVHVVHNGIYPSEAVRHYQAKRDSNSHPTVLFLGRVTFQKGPDYFVHAAAKVLPHVPTAQFVLAGSGDMLEQVKNLARELRIEQNFFFPGFLRGSEVEEMFSVADVYVMPSVSEPFGIAALEAINFEVPALISRQSGVAEVVDHSLKFDFWDVDRLADLIINALLHTEMRAEMVEHAKRELNKVRWDASAAKTIKVYEHVRSGSDALDRDRVGD